ncbi:helix-turn-helix domain-containing protein [Argonema antarcticum]|uniref:helix-turn-helix domain-containing protein n=1 Tax=Argonema antarcticum TaxID=2942763 RepID=UPI002011C106|nr:helix-turn-helix transcriptional regulator [Argonema antarcticum]MCL1473100.1 helix-turn-helix transcriptional regulator [Argonema antarcticum A004/B2]
MIPEIFRQTLEYYGITGKQISQVSGVSENHISEFRRGKSKTGVSTDVLWKFLEAMEKIRPGSCAYFCSQLAKAGGSEGISESDCPKQLESLLEMQNFVDGLSDDRLALLLMVVAGRIKNGVPAKNRDVDLRC